jgi:SHS2 domain-containing protein
VAGPASIRTLGSRNDRLRLHLSWDAFEHEADIGLVIRGTDGPELFATAGLALFDLVCRVDAVVERERYELFGEADNREALLVDWLNDLIFHFEGRGVVCRRFAFPEWSSRHYRAEAFGEPIDEERHQPRDLVKAATYHGLSVTEAAGSLEARVILDV